MAVTACNYGAHDFVHEPDSHWATPEMTGVMHVHVCANCGATYFEARPGPCYACRPDCHCPTDSEIDAAIEAATNHLLHRGNR